jgi:hypothetical protein
MATANQVMHVNPGDGIDGDARREPREDTIRIVEYAHFPRDAADQRQRLGFTRDFSRSGMCLGADNDEGVGALLKLCVRDLDGRSPEPVVARVVWSSAERDGRFWLGLQLISDAPGWELAA